jgi:hypothetical protein
MVLSFAALSRLTDLMVKTLERACFDKSYP